MSVIIRTRIENAGAEASIGLTGYENASEQIVDELRWLNRQLAAFVLRMRQVNFYDSLKNFRGLFIADEEIDALIATGIFESQYEDDREDENDQIGALLLQAQEMRERIDKRVELSAAEGLHLPLVRLTRCFDLDHFEYKVIVACLAAQIDMRYQKFYAYLLNDHSRKAPSVGLLLDLFCSDFEARLGHLNSLQPGSKLQSYHLIEMQNPEETLLAESQLKLDIRILSYLLGQQNVDYRIKSLLTLLPPAQWGNIIIDEPLRVSLVRLFHSGKSEHPYPIIHFYGRDGVGKKTVASALCTDLGVRLAVVNVGILLKTPESFDEQLNLVLREALLQPFAIYFEHIEKLDQVGDQNPELLSNFFRKIEELSWCIFLGSETPLSPTFLDGTEIYSVAIPSPGFETQKQIWELHLGEDQEVDKDQLSTRFDLTGGQIARAVKHARQFGPLRDSKSQKITLSDLAESSRIQSQPKLSALARKIDPKFTWDDIVLPAEQMKQLQELTNQVKFKYLVMEKWGFTRKISLGRGLNALFAGPSGTGKTMAAEVVANDLDLDLYKIDLSAVVSKYIGETEKNLNRVFTEAEHSNSILFFDEADALLGKRSEVKDAHDRYANLEIAYLLQKMEEYEGMTILATNLRQNIDEAFTRRIRFIVDFPFPEEPYRLRIWHGIWPDETPLDPNVDLKLLARQFELTGGHIRNIALAAAFYAAKAGHPVTMNDLIRATKRELQKMGKLCVGSNLGLFDEVVQNS